MSAAATGRALAPWLLMLPALAIVVIFFGVPMPSRIDTRIPEALADLGAGPGMTFVEVLLPLTRTGIAVASVILAVTVFACLAVIVVWHVRQLGKTSR